MYNLIFSVLAGFIAFIYITLLIKYTYRNPIRLIYIMLVYVVLEKFLIFLGFPSFLKYGTDVICLWMLACLLFQNNKIRLFIWAKWPMICVGAMAAAAALSVVMNLRNSNFLWFLWHVRNYYRMVVFWACAILWLRPDDFNKIFKLVVKLFLINIIVCSIQYFAFGYKGDYLGGIFGIEKGVNADMNMLLCMTAIYAAVKYLSKKMSLPICLLIMLGCGYIAALAELKFLFFEIAIIVACSIIASKPSAKSIGLLCASILITTIGIYSLIKIFPSYTDFFKLDSIVEYADINYGPKTGLSKLSGAQTIYSLFLKSPIEKIFGIGAGNAGISQFSFLQSDFARTYEGIIHYSWNYTAMIILETGLAGLVANLAFFISIMIEAIKTFLKYPSEPDLKMALVFCVLILPLIYYNAAFRGEIGYFAFFILAVPFAYRRTEAEQAVIGVQK